MTSAPCKQGKSSPDPMDTKVWLWVVCFYALIRHSLKIFGLALDHQETHWISQEHFDKAKLIRLTKTRSAGSTKLAVPTELLSSRAKHKI